MLHPLSARTVALPLALLVSLAACSTSPAPRPPSPVDVADRVTPDSIVGRRARVREAATGSPTVESFGIVRSLTRDSLGLDSDGGVRSVPLSPTVRLEISRGVRANTGRGAWIGALVGGLGMGAAGALICDGSGGLFDPKSSECAMGGALLGGTSGALIGLVFGALVRTERWEVVHPAPGIPGAPPARQGGVRGG